MFPKNILYILFLLLIPCHIFGQDIREGKDLQKNVKPKKEITDHKHDHDDHVCDENCKHEHEEGEHTHVHDHEASQDYHLEIDTTQVKTFWRITERTGEIIPGNPDTLITDYFNRTKVEGKGVSVAYLGNLGLPAESRIYFEREDRSDFMFLDGYWPYLKKPGNFNFINTKVPYSNVSYQRAGGNTVREERIQAILAVNINSKLNLGADVDYLYSRGFYTSQQSRHLEWVFFGNYISDRHKVHAFFSPMDYVNGENGGIQNDNYITHPELMGNRNFQSREIPVRLDNTWNQIKGKRAYLNYHYNLGYERQTQEINEEGDTIKQFIPVSSIIYTGDYQDRTRRFYTKSPSTLNAFYDNRNYLNTSDYSNDSTAYWSFKNTLALSLREGFSEWAKFDLTAFLTNDTRKYSLQTVETKTSFENDSLINTKYIKYNSKGQNSTYVGGELAKRNGKILRYDAQGSFGVVGYNIGDFDISGHIETRIPVWGDTASINLNAKIKNLAPTFYENHFTSKYFKWDNDFSKVKKVYLGGNINIPHTKTKFGISVENVTNYIYFDKTGNPTQCGNNIQIIGASLEQNFKLGLLHWDNRLVYQVSSKDKIIPLPDFCAYSSLYLDFLVSKVLTVQIGGSVHYWTEYYSPTYEPATQQFRLQEETKVGNYPVVSGFVNCHLKQARFFLEYYNAGAKFISPPEYFSLPHYPLNPTVLRLGVSVEFIN
ncbi:putative porin [Bacteroidales bacterium OttesenSCG-928-M11]|nr:putative porin [Bacteroidales bacterium OttesenSCG-928-M11]